MTEFTHLDQQGQASMVDVSGKTPTAREATATCQVIFPDNIREQVQQTGSKKGDLFASARIAGIMAAKKTAELIPLCHQLPLKKVAIDLYWDNDRLIIESYCKTLADTGVEMEALTAASTAALTIYDMCKGLDKGIQICQLKLLEKVGGKSGHWQLDSDIPTQQQEPSRDNR